jgi:hypothetical protein
MDYTLSPEAAWLYTSATRVAFGNRHRLHWLRLFRRSSPMRHTVLSCLVGLLLGASAHAQAKAPSVDGIWTFSMELMGNPLPETCTLHADGKTLKGVCKMPDGEADIVGEVDGPNLEWKHSASVMGNSTAFSFTGKLLDDGTMTGTMVIEAFGADTPFTAKRTGTGAGKA